MSVRFVHAADLHLGSPLRTVGAESERLAERLERATYDAFERIVDVALEEAVDFVVVAGDLDALAFEAVRVGDADQSTEELSRATAEQLFLAIRLAKVRRFETPLPVVDDDALTTLDRAHTARTIGLLDELARTNQVVFLTCHPSVVELFGHHADVGAFWTLEDGTFDGLVVTGRSVPRCWST